MTGGIPVVFKRKFCPHFSVSYPFQRFIPVSAFYPHFSVLSTFIPISVFYPRFSVLSSFLWSFQCFIHISVFYPHLSPFKCFIPISAFYPHSAFYSHSSVLSPFQRITISVSVFSFRFSHSVSAFYPDPLHKRVFQKCLDFSKTRKCRQNRYKTLNLSLMFEHKKTQNIYIKSKYNVNFPFNSESRRKLKYN